MSTSLATSPAGPAALFAALGDATRLHIVSRLCEQGPMSIVRLTVGTDVTRQAVTKHLEVLASAGIVRDFRHGRERVWELELEQLGEARRYLDGMSRGWDTALARLNATVEADAPLQPAPHAEPRALASVRRPEHS